MAKTIVTLIHSPTRLSARNNASIFETWTVEVFVVEWAFSKTLDGRLRDQWLHDQWLRDQSLHDQSLRDQSLHDQWLQSSLWKIHQSVTMSECVWSSNKLHAIPPLQVHDFDRRTWDLQWNCIRRNTVTVYKSFSEAMKSNATMTYVCAVRESPIFTDPKLVDPILVIKSWLNWHHAENMWTTKEISIAIVTSSQIVILHVCFWWKWLAQLWPCWGCLPLGNRRWIKKMAQCRKRCKERTAKWQSAEKYESTQSRSNVNRQSQPGTGSASMLLQYEGWRV